jgi:D-alanyl-D-alanine carboxypeptidase
MDTSRRAFLASGGAALAAAVIPEDAEAKARRKKKKKKPARPRGKARSSFRRASGPKADYTPDDPLSVVEQAGASTFAFLVNTGQVLHEHLADKPVFPASLIKMLTAQVVYDAVRGGRIGLGDIVTITPQMTREVLQRGGGPKLPFRRASVLDMLYATAILSSNEAAKALASHVAGSEENFVQLMQQKARQNGMGSTFVRNATGFSHPQQVTTARDIARLLQVMLREYQELCRIFSTKVYEGVMTMKSHNRIFDFFDNIVNKTGHTDAAGSQNAGAKTAGGVQVIAVTMNVRTKLKVKDTDPGTRSSRAAASANARLLKNSFESLGIDPNADAASGVDTGAGYDILMPLPQDFPGSRFVPPGVDGLIPR